MKNQMTKTNSRTDATKRVLTFILAMVMAIFSIAMNPSSDANAASTSTTSAKAYKLTATLSGVRYTYTVKPDRNGHNGEFVTTVEAVKLDASVFTASEITTVTNRVKNSKISLTNVRVGASILSSSVFYKGYTPKNKTLTGSNWKRVNPNDRCPKVLRYQTSCKFSATLSAFSKVTNVNTRAGKFFSLIKRATYKVTMIDANVAINFCGVTKTCKSKVNSYDSKYINYSATASFAALFKNVTVK